MRKFTFLFLLLALLCASTAWADMGDYVLKDGKAYRNDKGTEKLLPDDEPQFFNTDAGMWAWILVDPELSDEMKGSESGIYFFLDGKPVTFLPIEEAGACMMEFSPSGEKVIISRGTEAMQDLWLYFIEGRRLVKKKQFNSSGHSFWIDPHRFVFSSIDKSKGTRTKNEDDWQCSVALYDSVENEVITLKEATDLKDYFITGYDYDNGNIDVMEKTVKDKNDWNDPDKIDYNEISVPIPAAG